MRSLEAAAAVTAPGASCGQKRTSPRHHGASGLDRRGRPPRERQSGRRGKPAPRPAPALRQISADAVAASARRIEALGAGEGAMAVMRNRSSRDPGPALTLASVKAPLGPGRERFGRSARVVPRQGRAEAAAQRLAPAHHEGEAGHRVRCTPHQRRRSTPASTRPGAGARAVRVMRYRPRWPRSGPRGRRGRR